MRLTARSVEAAKPQADRRLEIADHLVRGLSLRVSAAGAKTWAVRYRVTGGQQRRLTLGTFPALSLEKARAAALAALARVAEGHDPARERLASRAARTAVSERPLTVSDLWRRYDEGHLIAKRPSTRVYQQWLWRKHLAPRLGQQGLTELNRTSVKAALRGIGAVAPIQANRALAVLRRMLNLAVEDEILPASPLMQFRPLFAETSRDRVLCDEELRQLWRALDATSTARSMHVSRDMCRAIKLILLTGVRAGDVAGMHADEIDQAARAWVIPAARFKGKRAHVVPLADAVVEILSQAFDAAPGDWSGYPFPARDAAAGVRRMSISRAMQRVVAFAGIRRATAHDLRRTVATYLASERIGVAPHVVTAVLGHAAEGPKVTAIYLRHRYDAEKRAALTAWSTLLMRIVSIDADDAHEQAVDTCVAAATR